MVEWQCRVEKAKETCRIELSLDRRWSGLEGQHDFYDGAPSRPPGLCAATYLQEGHPQRVALFTKLVTEIAPFGVDRGASVGRSECRKKLAARAAERISNRSS